MIMLDLCAGRKTASYGAKALGWEVISVDCDSATKPDICVDIRYWHYQGSRPDLIWASPPCDEFSVLDKPVSWNPGRKETPDLSIYHACKRIINESEPRYYCIENVRGAVRWFGSAPQFIIDGVFYLWTNLPHIPDNILWRGRRLKQSYPGDPLGRAAIPRELSMCIATLVAGQAQLFN